MSRTGASVTASEYQISVSDHPPRVPTYCVSYHCEPLMCTQRRGPSCQALVTTGLSFLTARIPGDLGMFVIRVNILTRKHQSREPTSSFVKINFNNGPLWRLADR